VAKQIEFSELIHVAIRPEMQERLNKLNRDRCSGLAPNSEIVRHVLEAGLAAYGYGSAQMQPQPMSQPMPSPFQTPMGAVANGR
jgi:hypothetical protein